MRILAYIQVGLLIVADAGFPVLVFRQSRDEIEGVTAKSRGWY